MKLNFNLRKIFYKIVNIFLLVFSLNTFATSGEGIPVQTVFFQVFNFSLFMIIIIYLARKRIPALLNQKKKDFLDYQSRAQKLETQSKSEYLILEKQVATLNQKKQDIKQSVAQSLKGLYKELEKQEKQELEMLKTQHQQAINHQKFEAITNLKNQLLYKVMQQTKGQLKQIEDTPLGHKLTHRVLKRWEQI